LRAVYKRDVRTALSSHRWDEVMKVQDDSNFIENIIDENLRNVYSGLNPKFYIGKKVLDKRLIKGTKTSNNRV
jgi:hypothetical protein